MGAREFPSGPTATHGISCGSRGSPTGTVRRPTGTYGIPRVIPIVPARSYGTPWRPIGSRRISLKFPAVSHRSSRYASHGPPWPPTTRLYSQYKTCFSSSTDIRDLGFQWDSCGKYTANSPGTPPMLFFFPWDTAVSHAGKKHPARHRGFPWDVLRFPGGCTMGPHGTPWYAVGSHGNFP